MWCIGTLTEEYRRRIYNLLALYAKPLCDDEAVILFDETSLQLFAHSREPLPWCPVPGPSKATSSWLNMAEIEIGILSRECLNRRISDHELLRSEVDAW